MNINYKTQVMKKLVYLNMKSYYQESEITDYWRYINKLEYSNFGDCLFGSKNKKYRST